MPGHGELRPVPPGPPIPYDSCLFCHRLVHMIRVSGHLQCPCCGQVVETCCEGISMAKASETQGVLL